MFRCGPKYPIPKMRALHFKESDRQISQNFRRGKVFYMKFPSITQCLSQIHRHTFKSRFAWVTWFFYMRATRLYTPLCRSVGPLFWAAAPKGRCPVGHRGEFWNICPSVGPLRPSVHPSPPWPLEPQGCSLRPVLALWALKLALSDLNLALKSYN